MSERHPRAGKTAPVAAPVTRHPVQLRRKCACGGSAGAQGECEECQKKRLQRSALDAGSVTEVPAIVRQVLGSPGVPLDAETRTAMEPHFGHDFGKVRIHADAAAAESARAVRATAYTVGRDVVFGAGTYAPGTRAGQLLMAHELAHVVQQDSSTAASGDRGSELEIGSAGDATEREADRAARSFPEERSSNTKATISAHAGATPTVRRAPWGKEYDSKDPADEKTAMAGMKDIKATTEIDPGGTPAADEIVPGILERIYPFIKADLASGEVNAATVERYRNHLNTAFRVMKIDTVEAQANYLAHASEESGQLRAFTESQGASQHWEEDPTKVKLSPKDLPKDKDVNPKGNWEFIGRGAVQVTHEGKYVEAIARLERVAEQYAKTAATDPKAADMAKKAQAAADAIKADPRNAAKPEYAFMVSAAFMKNMEGDRKASQTPIGRDWSGADSASGWVGGGLQKAGSPQAKALIKKAASFKTIFCVLLGEAIKAKKPVSKHKLKSCNL